MPPPNPFNHVLKKILSLGADKMIYPRVEETFENEWTSGFCDICASYPESQTTCETCNICLNSCVCHYCTLSALTFHLMGFDGEPEILQIIRQGDEDPNQMMAVSCMNRPICCVYGCMDLFVFGTISTLAALQIRHGIRKRYQIKESCLKSTAACMCCCFSLRQMQHELWVHGELSTAGAFFRAPAPPPANARVPVPEGGEAQRIENEIRLRTAQALVGVLEHAANRMERQQRQHNNSQRERERERRRSEEQQQQQHGARTSNNDNNSTNVSPAQQPPPRGYSTNETTMGTVVDSSDMSNQQQQQPQSQQAAVGVPVMD